MSGSCSKACYRVICVMSLSLAFSSFNTEARSRSCQNFFSDIQLIARQLQPESISLQLSDHSQREVLVNNKEVGTILRKAGGLNVQSFRAIKAFQSRLGTFDINVQDNGMVVAAAIDRSRGGYARAVWIRDLARVFEGFIALGRRKEAKLVALAMLDAMSSPEQLARLYDNIRDPGLHFKPEANTRLPHIRVDADNSGPVYLELPDGRRIEELWNHKQNDALALSMLVTYRAFEENLLNVRDLKPAHWQYLVGLPIFFKKLCFWWMHDSGAWEEWEARRTSSIGLVTKVFELYGQGFEKSDSKLETELREFLGNLRIAGTYLPEDLLESAKETWSQEVFAKLIDHGYQALFEQLPQGEAPLNYTDKGGQRFEDAALAHLFWYPLDRLEEKDYLQIFSHLNKLIQPAGIPRYRDDVYMAGLYYFQLQGSDGRVPEEFLPNGHSLTRHQLWELYNPRQPHRLAELFGHNLEPQWAIADPIMAKANIMMWKKFSKQEYQALAEWHLLRSWGMLTAQDANARGPLAADGELLPAGVMPESMIPIWVKFSDSKEKQLIYLPSKNTPLNWVSSELAIVQREFESLEGRLVGITK